MSSKLIWFWQNLHKQENVYVADTMTVFIKEKYTILVLSY